MVLDVKFHSKRPWALLEHQFVAFEKLISGGWHLHLTVRGQSILKAVTRN